MRLRPPVGLEMVVEVTGVNGVKLGEFGVNIDLYKTSAELVLVVDTRVAAELTRVPDTFWALSRAVAAIPGIMSATL